MTMKKLFTFCFFAFTMLIGTQSALAQNKAQINETAYKQAKELRSQLKFSDSKLEQVYKVYQAYENKLVSIKDNLESGTTEFTSAKAILNKNLQSGIKTALGNDLYKRYIILTEQNQIVD